jgi:hypothetical protein
MHKMSFLRFVTGTLGPMMAVMTACGGSDSGSGADAPPPDLDSGSEASLDGPGETSSSQCKSDKDCASRGLLCSTVEHICVQCRYASDCGDAELCQRGSCVMIKSCKNSLDCVGDGAGRTVCDAAIRQCVQCIGAADCGGSADCVDGVCIPFTPCQNSLTCPSGLVCDSGHCVQCAVDDDCESGEKCASHQCHNACVSDNGCTSLGLLCDRGKGYCVQCIGSNDCAAGTHCADGACAHDACIEGESRCQANSVVACSPDGIWVSPSPCSADAVCIETTGKAHCEADAGLGRDGAAEPDGNPPADASLDTAGGADGNPAADGAAVQEAGAETGSADDASTSSDAADGAPFQEAGVDTGSAKDTGSDAGAGDDSGTAVCGDGVVNGPSEACDDQNVTVCDGCEACQRLRYLAFNGIGTRFEVFDVLGSPLGLVGTPFTVEAWVRLDVGDTAIGITRRESDATLIPNNGWQLEVRATDNTIKATVFGNGLTGFDHIVTPSAITPAVWHHVAWTYDQATSTVFVDGQPLSSKLYGLAVHSSQAPVVIGAAREIDGSYSLPHKGKIDEIRVSRTIRYAAAFQPARRHTPDVLTAGLWHADEGGGTQLIDASFYAHPSALVVPLAGLIWGVDDGYGGRFCPAH